MDFRLKTKKDHLVKNIKQFDALIVAFSGGVDSAFLLALAHEILKENVIAVTAESPIHPVREKKAAITFAKNIGVHHIVLQSRELSQPEFVSNKKNRCYVCKKNLFADILKIGLEIGIKHAAHGANVDDLEDFRPGFKAAHEMGIIAPMIDAGLTKNEIRLLSKEMNLCTWNKPSMACLATRIPYGTPITRKALNMVEEAENVVLSFGFMTCRVRHHGRVARIEIDPGDIERMLDERTRMAMVKKIKKIGFLHIAVDLEGYVQGSMNRSLTSGISDLKCLSF